MALEDTRAAGGEARTQELDWDAVYADQLPRVYAYCRYRSRSDAEAEDLAARTFEKAWRARDRYRSDLAGFAPAAADRVRESWAVAFGKQPGN